jgi:hypothetical protein
MIGGYTHRSRFPNYANEYRFHRHIVGEAEDCKTHNRNPDAMSHYNLFSGSEFITTVFYSRTSSECIPELPTRGSTFHWSDSSWSVLANQDLLRTICRTLWKRWRPCRGGAQKSTVGPFDWSWAGSSCLGWSHFPKHGYACTAIFTGHATVMYLRYGCNFILHFRAD